MFSIQKIVYCTIPKGTTMYPEPIQRHSVPIKPLEDSAHYQLGN